MTSPFVAAGFKGRAARFDSNDLLLASRLLDVPPVALRAVIAVETAGSGFDAAGRPTMLFEPHIFYRQMSGDAQNQAVQQGLAYPVWGTHPYPATSDANYDRLTSACAIDERAALMSASWGLGQVMGLNFGQAGYASVQAMVVDAIDSEAGQIMAMCHFIKNNGLASALQRADWAAFARGYNGPGYAQNRYDIKLAAYVSAHGGLSPSVSAVAEPATPPPTTTTDDLNAAELALVSSRDTTRN